MVNCKVEEKGAGWGKKTAARERRSRRGRAGGRVFSQKPLVRCIRAHCPSRGTYANLVTRWSFFPSPEPPPSRAGTHRQAVCLETRSRDSASRVQLCARVSIFPSLAAGTEAADCFSSPHESGFSIFPVGSWKFSFDIAFLLFAVSGN